MPILRWMIAWMAATFVVFLRLTCRLRLHNDPRALLRSDSQMYLYSVLHAHQVAAVIGGEPGTGAMVSQSADGSLLVPSLRVRGIIPVRGSSNHKGRDKGGRAAFNALVEHVRGGAPAYLAVDGPRGPRNQVSKGIAVLSQKTGAAVINVVPVPARRWILTRAWDRMQIPQPFTRIDVYFGEPVWPDPAETAEEYRQRIERSLSALERTHDPLEADLAESATQQRIARRRAA